MKHIINLLLIGISIPTIIDAHENHHHDSHIFSGTRNYYRNKELRMQKKEIQNEKKKKHIDKNET